VTTTLRIAVNRISHPRSETVREKRIFPVQTHETLSTLREKHFFTINMEWSLQMIVVKEQDMGEGE